MCGASHAAMRAARRPHLTRTRRAQRRLLHAATRLGVAVTQTIDGATHLVSGAVDTDKYIVCARLHRVPCARCAPR